MEKECCNVKVAEIKDGYSVEITGKDVKDKCKSFFENCRTDGKSWKDFMKNCCTSNS